MYEMVTDRDILEILGPVDPALIAAIRAMAPTREELEEATMIDDEPFENLDDARIDELRAIIARRNGHPVPAPAPVAVEQPAEDDTWRPQD